MDNHIAVGNVIDIPKGCSARVEIDSTIIAIFNVNDSFYALRDTCSHAQASLAEGDLDEEACTIECPLHGSTFDLVTGFPRTLPATDPVMVYPVSVDDGVVYIDVPSEETTS